MTRDSTLVTDGYAIRNSAAAQNAKHFARVEAWHPDPTFMIDADAIWLALAKVCIYTADSTGRCNTLAIAQAVGALHMKQRRWIYYSETQEATMW
ncbi:hypothetical protein, partial [Paraburkholderia piptadeniae]|uniref:hypothetical protein n=1 Tax=Paraburkholderia piptadeniae TaxID=1701573 RepID=UPI001F1F49CA